MEMPVLEISQDDARMHLAEYEKQLTNERTVEDDAIRAGYRAIARGLPVISLPDVIAAGGFFDADGRKDNGLPRLAVARADQKRCWVSQRRDHIIYADAPIARNMGALVGRHTVRVDTPCPRQVTYWGEFRTLVPTIPPQHRPKRTRLHRFHILWEVEQWDMIPPVDPALIQHIRGDLWAVHATWDLTALEQSVLTSRALAR